MLELINLELRTRETCTVSDNTEDGKNDAYFDSQFPYSDSSLHYGELGLGLGLGLGIHLGGINRGGIDRGRTHQGGIDWGELAGGILQG